MTTTTPTPISPTSLNLLHTRYQSLQSNSLRRIGPALAFFDPLPSSIASPISLVRCVICIPSSDLALSALSASSSTAPESRLRIRGIVARSKQTKAGGTSCLFNHAQRSHPALLDALRERAGQRKRERDCDAGKAKREEKSAKTRRRSQRAPPPSHPDGGKLTKANASKQQRHDTAALALAAALAKCLIPPAFPAMYLPTARAPAPLPLLRAHISGVLAPLRDLPPLALTVDKWRGLQSLTLHVLRNARPARLCLGVLPVGASDTECVLPAGVGHTLRALLAPQGVKVREEEGELNLRFEAEDVLCQTARAAAMLAEEGAVAERVAALVRALNSGLVETGGAEQKPTPRPWVTGCCESILSEWDALAELGAADVEGMVADGERLEKGDWQVVNAVVAVLRLVKERVGRMKGWVLLTDAVAAVVGLVSAACDRVVMEGVDEVERSVWGRFLDGLYPVVRPLVEFERGQGHVVVAVVLDPRQSSMAHVLGMAKRLAKAGWLEGAEVDGEQDVRKRVVEVLKRYDEEVFVPLMMERRGMHASGNMAEAAAAAAGATAAAAAVAAASAVEDGELGLFEESFSPSEDWKLRRCLTMELNSFRALRKNIARNAGSEECLKWWDENAELFPNVADLFRIVVAIPASRVTAERIFTPVGAMTEMRRRMVPRKYLEDIVYVHENLTPEILVEIQGVKNERVEENEEIEEVDLEVLYDLAPDLFCS